MSSGRLIGLVARIALLNPALESMNRAHSLTHYSCIVSFFGCSFFLHLLLGFINAFFPFAVLSSILCICVSAVLYCGPRQSHSLCFDYPDNTLWRYKLWHPSWHNYLCIRVTSSIAGTNEPHLSCLLSETRNNSKLELSNYSLYSTLWPYDKVRWLNVVYFANNTDIQIRCR
jgi:hypothetical protein